ncbi:hypothetical protein COS93_00790 [bacterium (Candidatus Gribaldobacteria) CG07_land_8_20_14_0_80_33_18]|uniref:DOD-type homing endonuclease domain-containing protein n=1 Tax=bacterium (Candidatus Gribaldobacteria) CG07_land_8_20_14_0_80_33_18 TaxID=2014272 RepID=A0A2M6Z3V6_9BACT|nr:MAG: hypothetical protein COU04_01915 [bacterium (Candidatus Gribaldobacteria) CG10_big_fil_rev_8_21_14_0_10_33_41]PIU47098.1 MAG: hypothetical protein COS93_00790 [bacterium (Candidatus Gribaldobacteria) CG07_land_8_20_14_0_80_33_18]PJA01042.1 MAG: hypothetical protein COX75_00860 [bacterium (Candidatus Gribaldobacteria) CG_4_10_14_0_2_um_filter_33_15]PJB08958.1 MAG: hypothetical protein CO122_00500 [bacterium (Candidatus Gribaldobacteria) CG_4_9_14_3_um_filter_33_9]
MGKKNIFKRKIKEGRKERRKPMKFIADFHIHSKFSRATSSRADLANYHSWAKIKGIKVLGTGDFTHPVWFGEIKEKLEERKPGLFQLKDSKLEEVFFILTSEISCIYSKKGKVRKIHILIFAPNFETVEKINTRLNLIGNLKSDGRPILGLDVKELAKIVLNISEDCLIVPAHCLLPDTYLHSNPGIKKIKDISIGDKVYTHEGRLKKVKQIYTRFYKGPIYDIKPYNFGIGLKTTPEHPFYIIKTYKKCTNMGGAICKPACAYIKRRNCSYQYFKNYHPQWVQAKDIEKGDIIIFPRFNGIIKDVEEIKLNKYLNRDSYELKGDFIKPANGTRANFIPNTIKVNKEFCQLVGYYLSEGYTDNRDSVCFCFNENEKEYIKDVKRLMVKIFHLSYCREQKRKGRRSIELIFFSKLLAQIFSKIFYNHPTIKRAHTKCLPSWMLNLPLEKKVEIFKKWWEGDTGGTSSRELMNQMKIILLQLGIIPSIYKRSKEEFNKKPVHKIGNRTIKAQYDHFNFYGLSFFQDLFGLLKTPDFKKFKRKLKRRHGWIDQKYIYIPVRDIEVEHYKGMVYNLEVENDNSYVAEFATVHNCWTPWFSVFGSKSGFNSIEECFEEYSKYIYAGETGLSSDPGMNWRLSALDKITLISNSDAHSPAKLGREANVFDTELSYPAIIKAIKEKNPKEFLYTIEFFPEEGKYHYDGHRLCGVSLSPAETKKYNGICPVCGRPLTIGVLNRVEKLADRPEGFKPEGMIPYKSLVPLEEIIAEALEIGVANKKVEANYNNLIEKFGSEFNILLEVSTSDLEKITLPKIAEGIRRVREGEIKAIPGYDGVYGKIKIFGKEEEKSEIKQKTLF